MWRNRNLHMLPVRVQSGAAALDNSLEVSQKVRHSHHVTRKSLSYQQTQEK